MQRFRFIAITALALLAPHAAVAQDVSPPATATLTPPKLTRAAQPVYPPAKLQSGETGSVALVLTLDDSGQVTDVAVATSAGDDFDQAAIAAAKELRFTPAERNGVPVASKIPFRIEFSAPPAAPAPAPALAPPSRLPLPPSSPAPAAPSDALDIDVEGERPPREPTQRSLAAEEIMKIPGTNGDALRSLQNMPGVARAGAFDGLLIVRGSSPRDTQVFIDSTNVPLVYHFGGLSSVVPSEVLEPIDLYPGNFRPQYGPATGGILKRRLPSPPKEKLGGFMQVNLVHPPGGGKGPG